MTEKIQKSLRDTTWARWVALALVSLTMFFAYYFVDVAAPLKGSLERYLGWSSEQYGWLGGSEFILNVMGFLILSGVILDKMGIRFTLRTSALAMFLGGGLKFYGIAFVDPTLSVNIFGMLLPITALVSYIGFAIFGIGVEMAGITVSKTIVKWFKGKELALAMGLEMATARLGVFAVFQLSPRFAGITEATPLGNMEGVKLAMTVALAFVTMGSLLFIVYTMMDAKLDKQTGESIADMDPEDKFKFSDLGVILKNPGFLTIAGLCVLFYSAIFPFQKFAAEMLSSKLDVSMDVASSLFSWFPIGALLLTPVIGYFLDKKGYGASMMLFGAVLLVVSHLIFALVPEESFTMFTAVLTIVVLGTAFSLVPASMWPSIPKIVEERLLGSAYGLIFWIQNIGLMAVPALIGWALTASNPGVGEAIARGELVKYDYTVPEFIFAGFGALAIILALILKAVDKKKGYGLELPNIQEAKEKALEK